MKLELSPDVIATKTIDQLVSFFGDGKLRDNSECSLQLRAFLKDQSSLKLAEFAQYCLETKFEKSGQVLQDVVNEIGTRLGFSVIHGRYSGTVNANGCDGIWNDGEHWLVVEVKTTDAYRINLDTVAGYAVKAKEDSGLAAKDLNTLIVVGRQDTGDLEAQVRGSRHAWTVRLISVDALVKLMYVKEEVEDETLHAKITKVLLPIEYTRIDDIVDLVFETQQETDQKAQTVEELEEADAVNHSLKGDGPKFIPQTTSKIELASKRKMIVDRFFSAREANPVPVTTTSFEDASKGLRITCALSKRYKRDNTPYWYAFHEHNIEFLKECPNSYFVLGCMDSNIAFALPLAFVLSQLDKLNKTEKGDRQYWHIKLYSEDGKLFLSLPKVGSKADLSSFAFAAS